MSGFSSTKKSPYLEETIAGTQRVAGTTAKDEVPRVALRSGNFLLPKQTAPDLGGHRRGGHTLVELVVSLVAGSLLMAGLGSTLYIATQTATISGPTQDIVDASEIACGLTDELAYATYVAGRTARMIEFVVADRDGDGTQDTIRYEWSGTAGDPLTRTLNHGTPQEIAAGVEEFVIQYLAKEKTEEIPTTQETDESILVSHTALLEDHSREIKEDDWAGQYFHPDGFDSPLPEDALSWKITKVAFQAKQKDAPDGQFAVQLREAGGDHKPTSNVLGEQQVAESSLSSGWSWKEVALSNPVSGLRPNANMCLVIKWAAGEDDKVAVIRRNDREGSGWLETSNSGASWNLETGRKMYYKIHGTVTTPGPPLVVTRKYLANVRIALRTGSDPNSRVDTGVQILNTPELLSGYWKADFDGDPTTLDVNGDAAGDWIRRDLQAFNTATLSGSVWSADAVLNTNPKHDFDGVTTIEARFRNSSLGAAGNQGAVLWINADWSDGMTAAGLFASLVLQPDNTQTLTVYRMIDASTPCPLVSVPGLGNEFVSLRLVIAPDDDLMAVWVDNVFRGSYAYFPYALAQDDRYLTIAPWGSTAEFDSVTVRVAESDSMAAAGDEGN